jgi:lipoic acid synthetase
MLEQQPRPKYLKTAPLSPPVIEEMTRLMRGLGLHTICESARCPNRTNCFGHATATFLILGNTCTRHCTFCAVNKGLPEPVDRNEPDNIVRAIERLQLKYAVITAVTRDDLPDGGAAHFAEVIEKIREYDPPSSTITSKPCRVCTRRYDRRRIIIARWR